MLVSLNTDICPIVIPDTYGATDWCWEVSEEMWEDFKKLLVDKAKDAIVYVLDDLGIPYTAINMGGFHSPKEYNHTTDWIEFELEMPDDYVETIKANVRNDEESFFRFAKNYFGSYDGFISFYPYKKEKFYKSEDVSYIVSMWIMYRMDNENNILGYQREFIDDVDEYARSNGYMEDDEDYGLFEHEGYMVSTEWDV